MKVVKTQFTLLQIAENEEEKKTIVCHNHTNALFRHSQQLTREMRFK